MGVWPLSLPQYLELGMEDERQAGFLRSAMDTGPAKQRKRFTATSRMLRGTMLFTAAQRATFETFYVTTLGEGSEEFDMTDPLDNTTQTFRFMSPPTFSALAGGSSGAALWRGSFELERLP